MNLQPIGVFDSGIGGISVLAELIRQLPQEDFIFYGDNKNAPYGVREAREIRALSTACVQHLVDQGVKAVVVACNTASSAAIDHLRGVFSLPIVAMEPAIRPASRMRRGGKILVLATEATLSLERYHSRIAELGIAGEVISLACPRFVELVEQGVRDEAVLLPEIRETLLPIYGQKVDVVVLGCTHFIHLQEAIGRVARELFPGTAIIDGNHGTAVQLQRVLERSGIANHTRRIGRVVLQTSGDPEVYLPIMEEMLKGIR
jgi:glutamate racemase